MDTEPRNVTPGRVSAGTGGAADATFQWPPLPQEEGTEPPQANSVPAAKPEPHAGTQPPPGVTPRVPDPAEAAYLGLEKSLRQNPTARPRTADINQPPRTRLAHPALKRRSGTSLRSPSVCGSARS